MTTPDEYETLQQWAFQMEPVFTDDGGSWTGSYPGADWSVSAPTEAEAREKLGKEFVRRQNAGEDALGYADAVYLRHLQEPVPGVYAMDNEVYLQLKDEPWTEHGRAFKEAEAKRVQGQPYTKEDFLRGRDG
jgi:hypothetical protein